jgi:hypothetical protein
MIKDKKEERKVAMPSWKGRPISDDSHSHDLEQRAAIYEFQHKLPKEAAEQKAHEDYQKEQHLQAAASHYVGMKASRATGDNEEAKKHHMMYTAHMQHLGFNPLAPLPSEVEHYIEGARSKPFYSFAPHIADGFLFQNKK